VLSAAQWREVAQETPPDYVLDSRRPLRVPDGPLVSKSFAVCHSCAPELARSQRCDGCPMSRAEDGKLPAGSRLVRY
jgi:hypothetical protein